MAIEPKNTREHIISLYGHVTGVKKDLHQIHFQAWKKGLKSLYYCRSKSIQRAENVNDANSTDIAANVYKSKDESNNQQDYEECLSCQ